MGAPCLLREIPVKYLCWQLRGIARYPTPASFPVRTPRLMGLFLQVGIVPLSGGGFGSRSSVESPKPRSEQGSELAERGSLETVGTRRVLLNVNEPCSSRCSRTAISNRAKLLCDLCVHFTSLGPPSSSLHQMVDSYFTARFVQVLRVPSEAEFLMSVLSPIPGSYMRPSRTLYSKRLHPVQQHLYRVPTRTSPLPISHPLQRPNAQRTHCSPNSQVRPSHTNKATSRLEAMHLIFRHTLLFSGKCRSVYCAN